MSQRERVDPIALETRATPMLPPPAAAVMLRILRAAADDAQPANRFDEARREGQGLRVAS
jgi:hypothetical protein